MQDEELVVPADSCETTGEREGDTGDKSSQTTPNLSQNTPQKKCYVICFRGNEGKFPH